MGEAQDRKVLEDPIPAGAQTALPPEFTVIPPHIFSRDIQSGALLSPQESSVKKILNQHAFQQELKIPAGPTQDGESLTVGIPLGLIGQQYIFGAVITGVSDGKSELLGQLKLTDLTPLHVKVMLARDPSGQYGLVFMGCASRCTENSAQSPIIGFPVLAVDPVRKEVVIDLSLLGGSLDLIKIFDPAGDFTRLKSKFSKTVRFDYTHSTLVFDVESHMTPIFSDPNDPKVPITIFTSRWYLKASSSFNPGFIARPKTAGVGFFMTERALERRITRFATTSYSGNPVFYYIKNVPTQWRAPFAAAIDEWNAKLKPTLGQDLIGYEFLEETDPRYDAIVTGDIRYNVIEWDLTNKAPYGGLGPSIAHQFTGETISANTLIQGPTIIGLYSKWFETAAEVQALRSMNKYEEAERLLLTTKRKLEKVIPDPEKPRTQFKLTGVGGLEFRITSQLPSLEDPLFQRDDFDEIPAGETFESYMAGYFQEMVAHELGHNLGLRHNFRGNLGAEEPMGLEKVSRSVMEYLGRSYRYLDRIGPYDLMAIAYGYRGTPPAHTNWFCTDEEKPTPDMLDNSAECSSEDATQDPYGYFGQRLAKGIDLLIARGQDTAPVWSIADMDREMKSAVINTALYAVTASSSSSQWTNFVRAGRPNQPAQITAYVLEDLRQRICDPELEATAELKATQDAKEKTLANINDLRLRVAQWVTLVKLSPDVMSCTPAAIAQF